jgi:hypothetical protein
VGISLGGIALPDGLVWEDELDWTPVVQSSGYALDGSLILEEAERLAGRPITLRGGPTWVWMARADLLALIAALEVPGVSLTLTLHDASTHTVTARRDSTPVTARPVPAVMDSGPADPSGATKYWVDAIRLLEIP